MKRITQSVLALLLMLTGSTNVMAGDKIVVNYSFDDADNPVLTAAGHSAYNYGYTSVVTNTVFLNLYDTDNNNNGDTQVLLSDADLSTETWTLDFYWAEAGGTNNRPGYTRFFAGETELFTITDEADGGKATMVNLVYGEDGTGTLSIPAMNKSNRMKASIATIYNKNNYWYHFVVVGSPESGVKMTITSCNDGTEVVSDAVLSATNVSPTSLTLRPAACGAIGIDELKLTYLTDEAVANIPTVSLTKVAGNDRVYTIAIGDGETLHYILPGGEEQTSAQAETEVTATQDGDLVAWTTNGEAVSERVVVTVTTGAVALADINFSVISLGDGGNKTVMATIDNSNVLLRPVATITYDYTPAKEGEALTGVAVDGNVEINGIGTYVFTASAEGYTSTTYTFENTELELINSVDVTTLDPTTVSDNWIKYAEAKTVGSDKQWARYFTEPLEGYWYNFASETAASTDILEGLTLQIDANGMTPQIFTTLGLMYPVHKLNEDGTEKSSDGLTGMAIGIANATAGTYAQITYRPGYSNDNYTTIILRGEETWTMNRFDKAITKYEIFKEKQDVVEVGEDFTSYIVNADLTGTDGWNTEGTKGYHSVGGVVTAGNNAQFDFSQTIKDLPAGEYKLTAKAAYRYSGSEQEEYDAIQAGTETKFADLYAKVGEEVFVTKVKNRYDGASATDYAGGSGSVKVNELYVPNSSSAMKAWFEAGEYVNEVTFTLPADGDVTIGIVKTAQPEAGDYTVIGPWTLTRIADVVVGIETVKTVKPAQQGIFNLAGQRVAQPTKGLYIVNGKKVVVK